MGSWGSPIVAMSGTVLVPPPAYTLGTPVDLGVVQDNYALFDWIFVQSGDAWNVAFQGSVDGTNWYDVGGDITGSLGGSGLTETIGPIVTVGSKPARYVRLTGSANTGTPALWGLVSQRL